MMKFLYSIFILISISFSIATYAAVNTPDIKTYKYTFSKEESFKVAFADYPQGREESYELASKNNAILPHEINTRQHGLKISGNNNSDDLFMYAYKKVSGLKPNTLYHVDFSIEFASNAEAGSVGAGGSHGDSVFVKMGAVSEKPRRYVNDLNLYQITLDKGNQEVDGKDHRQQIDDGVKHKHPFERYGVICLEKPVLLNRYDQQDHEDEALQAEIRHYATA